MSPVSLTVAYPGLQPSEGLSQLKIRRCSVASWDRLEMKPHEPKNRDKTRAKKRGETKSNKKPNRKKRKGKKNTKPQKKQKGANKKKKNFDQKAIKEKETKIKVLPEKCIMCS
jgi:hypothetical protein